MFLLFDEKIIRSCHIIPGIIDQKVIAALLRHEVAPSPTTKSVSSISGASALTKRDVSSFSTATFERLRKTDRRVSGNSILCEALGLKWKPIGVSLPN
jgi:hypothetical protein